MKELLADAFVVMHGVITQELKEEPAELLGQATWSVLLETHDVYSQELTVCRQALAAVAWDSSGRKKVSEYFRCAKCDSELLKPVVTNADISALIFRCSSCGDESGFEDLVEKAVEHCWFAEMYLSMTDGGDAPIEDCPECGNYTFVVEEGQCVNRVEG